VRGGFPWQDKNTSGGNVKNWVSKSCESGAKAREGWEEKLNKPAGPRKKGSQVGSASRPTEPIENGMENQSKLLEENTNSKRNVG